jgi:hypothetical protein
MNASLKSPVPGLVDDTFLAMNEALKKGSRGLPGNNSLSLLIKQYKNSLVKLK